MFQSSLSIIAGNSWRLPKYCGKNDSDWSRI